MANDNFYNRDGEFIPIDYYLNLKDEKSSKDLEQKVTDTQKETSKSDDHGLLKEILTDKIGFLTQILKEIDGQIKDRANLKDVILYKLDKGICYLRTKIYEIETWGLGKNRNIDTRRAQIEKELEDLKAQKRDENRESWRDTAILRKEHREFYHEYRSALKRVKVIFPERFKDKSEAGLKYNEK